MRPVAHDTVEEARARAEEILEGLRTTVDPALVITDVWTRPWGWVFFWTTAQGDPLFGNGPLVVRRHDARVDSLGTGEPPQIALARYEKRLRRELPVPSHVTHLQHGWLHVVARDPKHRRCVEALGGRWSLLRRRHGRIRVKGDPECAASLAALRDAGFALAFLPYGWPPAAIFAHLRDEGLVAGTFYALVWTDGFPVVCTEASLILGGNR